MLINKSRFNYFHCVIPQYIDCWVVFANNGKIVVDLRPHKSKEILSTLYLYKSPGLLWFPPNFNNSPTSKSKLPSQ